LTRFLSQAVLGRLFPEPGVIGRGRIGGYYDIVGFVAVLSTGLESVRIADFLEK
jgi:hypothetical protein